MGNSTSSALGTVIVVGGGYAGVKVARDLDKQFNVVLVEPKEYFYHCVASVRSTTDDNASQILVPYDRLLNNGVVVRSTATKVTDNAVTLENGTTLHADYVVVATGQANNWPSVHAPKTAAEARATLQALREGVAAASRILVVGGGPVGCEVAGEIAERYGAEKKITLATSGPALLDSRFHERAISRRVAEQLQEKGVAVKYKSRVTLPDSAAPHAAVPTMIPGPVNATVGEDVSEFDLVLMCTGAKTANSAVYADGLAGSVNEFGRLQVEPTLAVKGHATVFAAGDCAETGDMNLAFLSGKQAEVVVANIRALGKANAKGDGASPALKRYTASLPGMFVTTGPSTGAGQIPNGSGTQVRSRAVRMIKGKGMFTKNSWQGAGYKGITVAASESMPAPTVTDERVEAFAAAAQIEPAAARALLGM